MRQTPQAVLLKPRSVVRLLVRLRDRLGLPEPDQFWQTTAQVRWGSDGVAPFLIRVWCLYAGHDMRRVKVRERIDWRTGSTDQLICSRCDWKGPWL